MKAVYDFRPTVTDAVTITSSTDATPFVDDNLKIVEPVKAWKSSVITESWVKYNFGTPVAFTYFFLNRFNFASFKFQGSANDSSWTTIEEFTDLVKDEIYDENYMHIGKEYATLTYQYYRILIAAQTPLFETGYFKIGNFYLGTSVDIWGPKNDSFKISIVPKITVQDFSSGYFSAYKIGRTRRIITGDWDKFVLAEDVKIRKTIQPFILDTEFEVNTSKVYLVRNTKEMDRSYSMATLLNANFTFEEII